MKIALGSDHAGFELKQQIGATLRQNGHEVIDVGTNSTESTDYPNYAAAVARNVSNGSVERGVLVCSTGVGVMIAANKINGIRAGLGVSDEEVRLMRQHNNANVLTLGARYTAPDAANEFVKIFLETEFEGGRHQRRVDLISQLERK